MDLCKRWVILASGFLQGSLTTRSVPKIGQRPTCWIGSATRWRWPSSTPAPWVWPTVPWTALLSATWVGSRCWRSLGCSLVRTWSRVCKSTSWNMVGGSFLCSSHDLQTEDVLALYKSPNFPLKKYIESTYYPPHRFTEPDWSWIAWDLPTPGQLSGQLKLPSAEHHSDWPKYAKSYLDLHLMP